MHAPINKCSLTVRLTAFLMHSITFPLCLTCQNSILSVFWDILVYMRITSMCELSSLERAEVVTGWALRRFTLHSNKLCKKQTRRLSETCVFLSVSSQTGSIEDKYCRDHWFKGKTLGRWVDMEETQGYTIQIRSLLVYLHPNVYSFCSRLLCALWCGVGVQEV